ncbi:hypothetical protein D3C86_1783270 [compost metagenome]
MNLIVAKRPAAGVFVDVVVKLLELVTEARCGALTTTWVSANNSADDLASGF